MGLIEMAASAKVKHFYHTFLAENNIPRGSFLHRIPFVGPEWRDLRRFENECLHRIILKEARKTEKRILTEKQLRRLIRKTEISSGMTFVEVYIDDMIFGMSFWKVYFADIVQHQHNVNMLTQSNDKFYTKILTPTSLSLDELYGNKCLEIEGLLSEVITTTNFPKELSVIQEDPFSTSYHYLYALLICSRKS